MVGKTRHAGDLELALLGASDDLFPEYRQLVVGPSHNARDCQRLGAGQYSLSLAREDRVPRHSFNRADPVADRRWREPQFLCRALEAAQAHNDFNRLQQSWRRNSAHCQRVLNRTMGSRLEGRLSEHKGRQPP